MIPRTAPDPYAAQQRLHLPEPVSEFFGEQWQWPPHMYNPQQVPIPVGRPCAHCGCEIGPGQQGLMRNVVRAAADGALTAVTAPFHRACVVRMEEGSIEHLDRTCTCYGGTTQHARPDSPQAVYAEALAVFERVLLGR